MGLEQDDPAIDEATKEAISRIEGLRESEVPYIPGRIESAISPDKGEIEIGSDPKTHPLRKGKIKPASEIAETTDPERQPFD